MSGTSKNAMKKPDQEPALHLQPRPGEAVVLNIPLDTLETLKRIAANHDMSVEALLKLYIGHGLRQDASQMYADRVLEMTAEVLARHVGSEDEVAAILREIRSKAA
jgi:hypothetical protein